MTKNLIIIGVIIMLSLFMGGMFYCCSYEPIWEDDLPPQVNLFFNVGKLNEDNKDKTNISEAYKNCIRYYHRLDCQREVFGIDEDGKPNPVAYNDPVLFRNYKQCLDELK